jgi:hypothetical protein
MNGVSVRINGVTQKAIATPASYLALEHPWKVGDIIEVDLPMTLHVNVAPDDKQVQAAMYGPVVLAARLGTEELTTSMIYASNGPDDTDRGIPMPEITEPGVWFERAEALPNYTLHFRSKGREPIHSLVPLNQITDERYSVYLKNTSVA